MYIFTESKQANRNECQLDYLYLEGNFLIQKFIFDKFKKLVNGNENRINGN